MSSGYATEQARSEVYWVAYFYSVKILNLINFIVKIGFR